MLIQESALEELVQSLQELYQEKRTKEKEDGGKWNVFGFVVQKRLDAINSSSSTRRVTFARLAEALGISRPSFSRFVSGQTRLTRDVIEDSLQLLQVPEEQIEKILNFYGFCSTFKQEQSSSYVEQELHQYFSYLSSLPAPTTEKQKAVVLPTTGVLPIPPSASLQAPTPRTRSSIQSTGRERSLVQRIALPAQPQPQPLEW